MNAHMHSYTHARQRTLFFCYPTASRLKLLIQHLRKLARQTTSSRSRKLQELKSLVVVNSPVKPPRIIADELVAVADEELLALTEGDALADGPSAACLVHDYPIRTVPLSHLPAKRPLLQDDDEGECEIISVLKAKKQNGRWLCATTWEERRGNHLHFEKWESWAPNNDGSWVSPWEASYDWSNSSWQWERDGAAWDAVSPESVGTRRADGAAWSAQQPSAADKEVLDQVYKPDDQHEVLEPFYTPSDNEVLSSEDDTPPEISAPRVAAEPTFVKKIEEKLKSTPMKPIDGGEQLRVGKTAKKKPKKPDTASLGSGPSGGVAASGGSADGGAASSGGGGGGDGGGGDGSDSPLRNREKFKSGFLPEICHIIDLVPAEILPQSPIHGKKNYTITHTCAGGDKKFEVQLFNGCFYIKNHVFAPESSPHIRFHVRGEAYSAEKIKAAWERAVMRATHGG